MKINKFKIAAFAAVAVIFGQIFLIPIVPVSAVNGLWEQQTGLGDSESEIGKAFTNNTSNPEDVRVIVVKVVKAALGFIGIILVVIIISAGYKWMTAAGNEEKITEAREALTRAAIGLAIILMAWGITEFVTDCLLKATGAASSIWYCPEIN